jgi:Zn-finger nucleic acid-binding protein
MNELMRRIRREMDACPRCRNLHADQREAREKDILTQVARTQTRTLDPLPAHVWPAGRPFKTTEH